MKINTCLFCTLMKRVEGQLPLLPKYFVHPWVLEIKLRASVLDLTLEVILTLLHKLQLHLMEQFVSVIFH